MELKSKNKVEIFSAGKWNGDVYTVADLDEMVKAFDETSSGWKPPLKLGHTEDQKLLQSDGLPAAGWVGKLYRIGEKLYADFIDIPAKIFELMENKSYRKVSSEIYWDIDIGNDKIYNRMLAGVALLGADMPAVMNLSDITAWFSKARGEKKFYTSEENQPSIKTYEFLKGGEMEKTELEKLKADQVEKDKELADFKKYKADQETKAAAQADEIAKLKEQNHQAELDNQVSELSAAHKISPSMKPYVRALLEKGEKKEYSLQIGKGEKSETKKYASKSELIGEMLKLHAAALKLNTNETSVDGEKIPQVDNEEALDKKVKAYAKEHKCSYGQALKVIRAQEDEGPGDEDELDEDEE